MPRGWSPVRPLFLAVPLLHPHVDMGKWDRASPVVSSYEAPTLMTSSAPDYLLKAPLLDTIIPGLGLQRMNLGAGNTNILSMSFTSRFSYTSLFLTSEDFH